MTQKEREAYEMGFRDAKMLAALLPADLRGYITVDNLVSAILALSPSRMIGWADPVTLK